MGFVRCGVGSAWVWLVMEPVGLRVVGPGSVGLGQSQVVRRSSEVVWDRSVFGSNGLGWFGMGWFGVDWLRSSALNKLSHQGIQENPARNCAPHVEILPS